MGDVESNVSHYRLKIGPTLALITCAESVGDRITVTVIQ